MIEKDSTSQAWIESLKLFTTSAQLNRFDSRLGPCVEVEDLLIKVRRPRSNEDLGHLYQHTISSIIDSYGNGFLDPNNIENSTNSKRLYAWKKGVRQAEGQVDESSLDQISRVVDRLKNEPESRYNIVVFWDPEIDWTHPNPVSPLTAHFRIRSKRLHSTLAVRSVDAWLGALPMFMGFTRLHERLARRSNYEVGTVSFFTMSYHIYEMDLPMIQDVQEAE
jgi:thymidylate synthase